MTNFSFLKTDPQFATFADTAIQAELVLPISPAFTATGSRTALEFAVKWLYSVDNALERPYDDKLVTLNENDFSTLTYGNVLEIAEHIAPFIPPAQDEISAARFDMLVYQIELAMLSAKRYKRAKNDVIKKVQELSRYATIPAIAEQSELIEQIMHNDYLERAG